MKDKIGKDIYISRIIILEEVLDKYLGMSIGSIGNSSLKETINRYFQDKENELEIVKGARDSYKENFLKRNKQLNKLKKAR